MEYAKLTDNAFAMINSKQQIALKKLNNWFLPITDNSKLMEHNGYTSSIDKVYTMAITLISLCHQSSLWIFTFKVDGKVILMNSNMILPLSNKTTLRFHQRISQV